jgi:hypothetical protein
MVGTRQALDRLEIEAHKARSAGPKPWRLAGLLILLAALTAGCNLPSLLYFVTTGFQEPKEDPGEMKLAESGKEIKVVILTYAGLDMRPEMMTVSRDLSGQLARQLQTACKENRDKITVISPNKVHEYTANHPNWFLKPQEAGKHFDADKVVYLEVDRFSLYEPGSANQLYRGRTTVSVKLWNLKDPDDFPVERTFSFEYPTSRGPVPADDQSQREFYQAFLSYLVKHLSWNFTAHPLNESVGCD